MMSRQDSAAEMEELAGMSRHQLEEERRAMKLVLRQMVAAKEQCKAQGKQAHCEHISCIILCRLSA